MQEAGRKGFRSFAENYLGQMVEVLVETPWPQGGWEGHTDNYLRVVFKEEAKKGWITKVRLKKIENNYIFGEMI